MYIGKRSIIIILSYFMAAIAIMSGFIVTQKGEISNNQSIIATTYQRNFADLADSLTNIDYALQKAMYANSPYQAVSLAASVWKESGSAKVSLEQLPVFDLHLEKTSKFFSQTGDYVFSLAKDVLNGHEITDEERNTLQQMSEQAKQLANSMISIEQEILSKDTSYAELKAMLSSKEDNQDNGAVSNNNKNNQNNQDNQDNQNNDNAIPTDAKPEDPEQAANDNPENADNASPNTTSGENNQSNTKNPMQKMELEIKSMPKLIYDGSYSDHIASSEPVFIKNKNVITVDEALLKAAYILDVKTSAIKQNGDVDTKQVKSFIFSGNNIDIQIIKQGGYAYELSKNRAIGDIKLSDKEAIEAGKKFLDKINYKDMVETYYWSSGNVLTINYAYVQDDVVCYTDLIKVGVALDTGEIVSLSAGEYLMSHKTNRVFNKKLTEEEAKKLLNPNLTVEAHRMAVIPSTGYNDKYCHEFKTKSKDGTTVVVYINAQTGVEEDIMILLENENGTLVM